MIGAMLGCRPTETGGDLTRPNNCKFLRMLVIECSLHCAIFAICAVVSLFLLHTVSYKNHLTRPGIDDSGHFVSGSGDRSCCEIWRSVNERPHPWWVDWLFLGMGYFWMCNSTWLYNLSSSFLLPC